MVEIEFILVGKDLYYKNERSLPAAILEETYSDAMPNRNPIYIKIYLPPPLKKLLSQL